MFNESQQSIIDSITAISKQRDEAQAQAMALRDAARAFLDAFANQAARCVPCEEEGKREPVMLRKGLYMACDAHGRELLEAPEDFSYAPALRALRALVAG